MNKLIYAGLLALAVLAIRAEDEAEGEDGVEFEDNTVYRYSGILLQADAKNNLLLTESLYIRMCNCIPSVTELLGFYLYW